MAAWIADMTAGVTVSRRQIRIRLLTVSQPGVGVVSVMLDINGKNDIDIDIFNGLNRLTIYQETPT